MSYIRVLMMTKFQKQLLIKKPGVLCSAWDQRDGATPQKHGKQTGMRQTIYMHTP